MNAIEKSRIAAPQAPSGLCERGWSDSIFFTDESADFNFVLFECFFGNRTQQTSSSCF